MEKPASKTQKWRALCWAYKRKEERRHCLWQAFSHLVSSAVSCEESLRLELCFSVWCLSELRVLSFLTLAGSVTKQKNHFPARAACITLPALLLLPASCRTYSATAASRGQHQLCPQWLSDLHPAQESWGTSFFKLQAALCTLGISLSINASEVYLALCLPILHSPRARGRHDIQFTVQWLNNITIFISTPKLPTGGFRKPVKQAVRLTKDHAAAV